MRDSMRLRICVLMVLLLASCSSFQGNSPTVTETIVELPWQFGQELREDGTVVLSSPANLSFTTSGRLKELLVEHGDSVLAGDVLARLDASELEDAVFLAEARRDLAQVEFDRVMMGATQLELIEAENDLVVAENFVVLNAAQIKIKAAQISTAQARLDYLISLPLPEDIAKEEAELRLAQSNLEMARERVLETVLSAPKDGIVILINFEVYDYVGEGQTVIILGDPTDLSVEAVVSEADIAAIKIGDIAQVRFLAIPDTIVDASVMIIIPNQDTSAGNDFLITLKLHEAPPDLRWGMSAETIFQK